MRYGAHRSAMSSGARRQIENVNDRSRRLRVDVQVSRILPVGALILLVNSWKQENMFRLALRLQSRSLSSRFFTTPLSKVISVRISLWSASDNYPQPETPPRNLVNQKTGKLSKPIQAALNVALSTERQTIVPGTPRKG